MLTDCADAERMPWSEAAMLADYAHLELVCTHTYPYTCMLSFGYGYWVHGHTVRQKVYVKH